MQKHDKHGTFQVDDTALNLSWIVLNVKILRNEDANIKLFS